MNLLVLSMLIGIMICLCDEPLVVMLILGFLVGLVGVTTLSFYMSSMCNGE